MRRRGALLLAVALAGCAESDFARPGTWRAEGVNEANLHAMLAEPRHARQGAAADASRSRPGSHAVILLDTDRRRPLLDTRASHVGVGAGRSHAP